MRESAKILKDKMKQGDYGYEQESVEGKYAFLVWSAKTDNLKVCDGVDSFVIEEGKIVFQTAYYRPVKR